jgi:hypothetical protein
VIAFRVAAVMGFVLTLPGAALVYLLAAIGESILSESRDEHTLEPMLVAAIVGAVAALIAIGGLIAGSRWTTQLGAGVQAVAAGVVLGTVLYYLEGPQSDEEGDMIGLTLLTLLFDLAVFVVVWRTFPRRTSRA